jgi:hypothetical protein
MGSKMIGVLCNENERDVVGEFFELFKTPWEFYDSSKNYEVVLSTYSKTPLINSRLVIIYSSDTTRFDTPRGMSLSGCSSGVILGEGEFSLMIYGPLSSLEGEGRSLLVQSEGKRVAIEMSEKDQTYIRVGYDLFQEVKFLLTIGQSTDNSFKPTLENHIDLLRTWIVTSGITFIEIPPVPYGHSLIACITHDVDFAGIRYHKLDRTFWGFLYRALLLTPLEVIRGNSSKDRMLKNLKVVFTLPLVYMGIFKDFWEEFEAYAQIDGEYHSTFFIVPFKGHPGEKFIGVFSSLRATQYDINDITDHVKSLRAEGFEIGLHGIDAWHDIEKGKQELKRIVAVTGQDRIGIRMHWLYFNGNSPSILEQAGFDYDSTCGYNESIGFKNGTSQPFRPLGATRLLELPMVIQDTALFYPRRMRLNENQAWDICSIVLDNVIKVGGVITLSWHTRSLSPDRLWGEFYKKLLEELRNRKAWFGTAIQVVDWFRQRRSVVFGASQVQENQINIHFKCGSIISEPPMCLRIHLAQKVGQKNHSYKPGFTDLPYTGEPQIQIPLSSLEEI